MNIIFGASSKIPSNTQLTNGYTMYDWVMRKNCFPSFWARSILGENPISYNEIEFLRKKDSKIALVVHDLVESIISTNQGSTDGRRVINAAKNLGVPRDKGIVIFAEIKPCWSVNHNWMIGFAKTLFWGGYLPGFIGNTDSSKNFNFDRQCSHYVQATAASEQFGAIYCATEPKQEKMPNKWEPYCPSALKQNDMHFWTSGKITFGELEVEEMYARDRKVLDYLW